MDFLRAIKALKRWRFTFLGVFVVTFALVAFAPNPQPAAQVVQYQSTAKILLTPPSGSVNAYGGRSGGVGLDPTLSWFADPTILSEIFLSEELLTRVSTASDAQEPWNVLKGMIQIAPLSQSPLGVKLFSLTVTSNDPKQSQKLTRLVTEEFSNYVQELSAREFASTRKFIEELVVEAEQRRLQAEERLQAVREKYLGAPSETQVQSQQLAIENQRAQIGQTIPALQAETVALKAYLDGQVSTPPWTVIQGGDSGSLKALEAKVTEDRLMLEREREIYTEENEKVKTAKTRLAASQDLYTKGLRELVTSLYNSKALELQQAVSREAGLSSQLNTLLASQMTPDDRRETQKLERELNLWEENHLSLLQQLYQARVVEQSSRRQGSVNVLEQPLPGSAVVAEASSPQQSRSKKLALAIPFCLLLGAGAAMLREYLSTSLKLRPRIEEALELPVIAVIPATPSELTVDWERFKRPMASLAPLGEAASPATERIPAGVRANGSGKGSQENGRKLDEFRPDQRD